MTKHFSVRVLSMGLSLIVTTAATRAADPAVGAGEREKPVRGLLAAFGEAFAKLDAHAFSIVFHEDADFTNVWGMTAHGRKAIEEFHRPLLEGDGAGMIPSFKHAEFKVVETRIRFLRPDVAFVDAIWTQTGAIQNGKEMGPRKGLLMLVATQEGGSWGIAVMHNMDLPPAK